MRGAIFLRRGRGGGAVGVHGRLVEPQQILPAGRHARDCADDQLRNPAHPFRRHGDHDCWFAQDGGIVAAQNHYTYGLAHWFVFTPWGFAGFILFFIASLAESNRTPFDLPEAESEIIAGYFTEYSGFKFALFFLGEYLGMFAVIGLGITLFLGGWTAPFSFLTWCRRISGSLPS